MLSEFYSFLKIQSNHNRLFAEIQTESIFYRDLLQLTEQTVTFLRSLNLTNNQRIIIASAHDESCIILLLSCLLEGLCPILISIDVKESAFQRTLKLTNPALIFMDETEMALSLKKENYPVILINPVIKKQAFIHKILGKTSLPSDTYPGLLAGLVQTKPHCHAKPDDTAFIVFTSGSTATPKGVMLSYHNIFSHLKTFQKVFGYHEQSVLFNNLPLQHMDGLIQGPLITLYTGACLIRPEKCSLQNLDAIFNKVAAKKVTHVILVPSILALLDRYAVHDDYFSTPYCQMLISTAAYLNADLWSKIQARFKIKVGNVYGLIETVTGGLFCGPDPATFEVGTVGMPVDMIAKIVAENGELQADGEIGELLLQGDNVSQGYIGHPSLNMPAFQEGWLYTGDLARKNKQGLIEIVGRKKEVIISGGFTLYPEEINEVLCCHPEIKDAATFGLEDDVLGEIVVCVVEVGKSLTELALLEFCHQHLEPNKMPKHIIFLKNLPRGPVGKPLLENLKLFAKQQLNAENIASTLFNEDEIIAIAAKVFKLNKEVLSIHTKSTDILAWDSLRHIKLIEAIEQHFQVRFSLKDTLSITSLKELYERTKNQVK